MALLVVADQRMRYAPAALGLFRFGDRAGQASRMFVVDVSPAMNAGARLISTRKG